MAKQATKLKEMRLTSVDLVRAGANQEADICLFKSADPQEAAEFPTEQETNIFKRFLNWLRENPTEEEEEPVEKDYSTFDSLNANRDNNEKLWRYTEALNTSIRSIQDDNDLSSDEKLQKMTESLGQFDAAMKELFESLCKTDSGTPKVAKSNEEDLSYLTEDLEKSDRYDDIEEV